MLLSLRFFCALNFCAATDGCFFLQLASFQVDNVVELAIDNLIILCRAANYQLLALAAAYWILSFYVVLLDFNKFSSFIFFGFDP